MASRVRDVRDTEKRKRMQRVTPNDREKLDSVVKHDGLQRGAPSGQNYFVRGVFIDGGGDKRFCLRVVDAVPDFDIPDTVIEDNVVLGAAFYAAGLTLTDKELAKDLAAAIKEQEEVRRSANPANAQTLARVPAAVPAAAVLRDGRQRFPHTRHASSTSSWTTTTPRRSCSSSWP